jgi:2-polyprenyl-3-methyl-5-hydroxy-6-metoxy-1,4-benzoquinol methylase
MTFLDRWLQQTRIKKARSYIPPQAFVLDIGCHHGELFMNLGEKLGYGVGVDPLLEKDIRHEKYELLADSFPSKRIENKKYHCITMLAILEHIPEALQPAAIKACFNLLDQQGIMIITVPHPFVDDILVVLQKLRLMKGIKTEEHYGFNIRQIPDLFAGAGFRLVIHKKFQLGLNNLYTFKK